VAELPLVLTVEEAAEVLRIGRSACYEGVRRGEIPSVRIGRTLRVPRQALERMLGIQNGEAPDSTPALRETTTPREMEGTR
jgi:excisionase family DNA binding protein